MCTGPPFKIVPSRTSFAHFQVERMEEFFTRETHYPDIRQREEISDQVGLDEARVQVWFQVSNHTSVRLSCRVYAPCRNACYRTGEPVGGRKQDV